MIKRRNESNEAIGILFNEFIRMKKANGLSQPSIEDYEIAYIGFIRDLAIDEQSPVSFITADTIYSWIEVMQERNITTSSINHFIASIRVFLYWLMSEGKLNMFKVKLLRVQEPTVKYYTDEEIKKLIQKPTKKDNYAMYRTYAIICFILATGARAGTVVNIKIEDINFQENTICYRHLKNKSSVIIPMSTQLSKVLTEYIDTWNLNDDSFLFCDTYGNQLSVCALREQLVKYCTRKEVSYKGVHTLRHTFSRGWVLNNGNAFTLQKMLTHKSITMTKKYVNLFSDDLKINFEQYSPLDTLSTGNKNYIKRKQTYYRQ